MGILNTAMAYAFIRLLTQKWTDTDAFKNGIIDAKGHPLKKSATLTTTKERDSYSIFHRLVFNLKRILEKLPFGKTKLATYAAALWLVKEHVDKMHDGDGNEIINEFCNHFGVDSTLIEQNLPNRSILHSLYEEVTATGPAVAGINSDDTPGPANKPLKRNKFKNWRALIKK